MKAQTHFNQERSPEEQNQVEKFNTVIISILFALLLVYSFVSHLA